MKFSNRTDVGILVIQQLWPLLSAFPTFSFVPAVGVCPGRACPGVSTELRAQSQLRKGSWGPGEQGGNGARELQSILKEPGDLCLHPENAGWTPAWSHELRTALSTWFSLSSTAQILWKWVSRFPVPGFVGSTNLFCLCTWACCSQKLLKLYNCLCQHPVLSIKHELSQEYSIKHELSQEYPGLLIFCCWLVR